jgi:hypothetical protein
MDKLDLRKALATLYAPEEHGLGTHRSSGYEFPDGTCRAPLTGRTDPSLPAPRQPLPPQVWRAFVITAARTYACAWRRAFVITPAKKHT